VRLIYGDKVMLISSSRTAYRRIPDSINSFWRSEIFGLVVVARLKSSLLRGLIISGAKRCKMIDRHELCIVVRQPRIKYEGSIPSIEPS
jgi:hypothetical protein